MICSVEQERRRQIPRACPTLGGIVVPGFCAVADNDGANFTGAGSVVDMHDAVHRAVVAYG